MEYDVIIIGGRPAGSVAAAFLGKAGVRTLLLERAHLAEQSPVSMPTLFGSTMAILDEVGAPESEYAHNTPRLYTGGTFFGDLFSMVSQYTFFNNRAYAYSVERQRFDSALFRHAGTFPSVTALEGTPVQDILMEEGRVVGVRTAQGDHRAKIIVGADGRFSLLARKVGAKPRLQLATHSSVYYAYYRGVKPVRPDTPSVAQYNSLKGWGVLISDTADGLTGIAVEGHTRHFAQDESPMAAFDRMLHTTCGAVDERIRDAERVTPIKGMKEVGNYYREMFGSGWVLAGDAALQEDPITGQGIAHATFGGRAVAQALIAHLCEGVPWKRAMRGYTLRLVAYTLPMYLWTQVFSYVINHAPPLFTRIFAQVAADPSLSQRFMETYTRKISPYVFIPLARLPKVLFRSIFL